MLRLIGLIQLIYILWVKYRVRLKWIMVIICQCWCSFGMQVLNHRFFHSEVTHVRLVSPLQRVISGAWILVRIESFRCWLSKHLSCCSLLVSAPDLRGTDRLWPLNKRWVNLIFRLGDKWQVGWVMWSFLPPTTVSDPLVFVLLRWSDILCWLLWSD